MLIIRWSLHVVTAFIVILCSACSLSQKERDPSRDEISEYAVRQAFLQAGLKLVLGVDPSPVADLKKVLRVPPAQLGQEGEIQVAIFTTDETAKRQHGAAFDGSTNITRVQNILIYIPRDTPPKRRKAAERAIQCLQEECYAPR